MTNSVFQAMFKSHTEKKKKTKKLKPEKITGQHLEKYFASSPKLKATQTVHSIRQISFARQSSA